MCCCKHIIVLNGKKHDEALLFEWGIVFLIHKHLISGMIYLKAVLWVWPWPYQLYEVFSHDVTAAILVSQNNETAAMLVSQTNPVGVELFSYANVFFCSNKFA